jgi:dTDP-4-dehydrorhamnose reductase
VDVYPRTGQIHRSDEEILLGQQDSAYGLTKFLSESVVRERCAHHLILRSTGLLGEDIRPTTLTKLLTTPQAALSLSAASVLNFVHHRTVGDLISAAITRDVCGTLNVASKTNATLGEVAAAVNAQPVYGSVTYDIGRHDSSPAAALAADLNQSTLDVVRMFAADFRR